MVNISGEPGKQFSQPKNLISVYCRGRVWEETEVIQVSYPCSGTPLPDICCTLKEATMNETEKQTHSL